jgi:hypothetical protein
MPQFGRCFISKLGPSRGMFRLVEADLASTGKPYLCNGTPSLFLNRGALNILSREGVHLGFQVVAHEIEFVDAPDGWNAASAGGKAKMSQP